MKKDIRVAICSVIENGRSNAMSLREISRKITRTVSGYQFHPPSTRTIRRTVHQMQDEGVEVLSSPRSGVWMMATEGERIAVMDELRNQVAAIEKRIATINGGRCALRECRGDLPAKVVRRGGLYCCAEHRYQAAVDRGRRDSCQTE